MATLASYPYTRRISLRWKDNDVYGHVNNVEYYSFFDTVINEYLILEAGLDIHAGEVIGLCAESHCSFAAPVAFPGSVHAGLAVEHLGNASVRYAVGLFDGGATGGFGAEVGGSGAEVGDEAAPLIAEGWFVHVFVDRERRRPTAIPGHVRARLETITR
jgi:acyl-CoA thioester hydrolase